MTKISEKGHSKNVATFEDLISFCTGYGTAYNPSKNNIKLTALNTLLAAARGNLVALNNAFTAFNNATNTRVVAFDPLEKLVTRIVNALDATDAKKQTVNDAKGVARKMQGRRADPLATIIPTALASDGTSPPVTTLPTDNSISVSQMSYDSQIENLSRMITLLTAEPLYLPNENDLKLTALNALLASFKSANTAVINATTVLSNARITRNKSLYASDTGLHDIAQEVKKYVKSVFGAKSPEYRLISGLIFTTKPL